VVFTLVDETAMTHKTTRSRDSSRPLSDDVVDLPAADVALIADLTSSDLEKRLNAQHGLVDRGRAAVPALLEALKDNDPDVRNRSAQMLTVIADPVTATALAAMLSDDEASVRWVAAEGLIALGLVGVRAGLQALVEADTISQQLKDAVRHILLKVRDDYDVGRITRPVLAAMHKFEMDELLLVEANRALAALKNLTPR
jgi:hypothetical protein